MIAGLLVTEGFVSVEDLVLVPLEELAAIEGFDEDIAAELKRRAEAFVARRDAELTEKYRALGVTDEVASVHPFTPAMLVALGEKGVKTLDDLADLASDELIEILGPEAMDEQTANAVIMAARAHWFEGEEAAAPAPRARPERGRVAAMLAETDAAPETEPETEPEAGPLRRCVLTGERQAKEAMIRFVVAPDGRVVPDLAARLPGRGMWLSAKAAVLEDRRLGPAFARAAKARVTLPDDLPTMLVAGLERRVAELLGLARRAGQAVAGFVAAREWVASGRAGLVVEARDGAPDGRRKLLAGAAVPVVAPLTAVQLGAVFARDHVVHVAIATGRLARLIATEAQRLAGVRGDTPGNG